jgi:tetrahydromethanopterin S-methyltransferase subunit B
MIETPPNDESDSELDIYKIEERLKKLELNNQRLNQPLNPEDQPND